MIRHRYLLCLAALSVLPVQTFLASTVQVGNCLTGPQNFSTISAAVSSVPPGSTVEVCPGTYAEQVAITKALTLVGVTSGTANQVLITVPSAGLVQNAVSMFGESVAAQVLVEEAGAGAGDNTNNIGGGTGGGTACSGWAAGGFFRFRPPGTPDPGWGPQPNGSTP